MIFLFLVGISGNYIHTGHDSEDPCELGVYGDPCHQSIAHHDLSKQCDHELHIYNWKADCDLCDILANSTLAYLTNIPVTIISFENGDFPIDYSFDVCEQPPGIAAPRGPPVVPA